MIDPAFCPGCTQSTSGRCWVHTSGIPDAPLCPDWPTKCPLCGISFGDDFCFAPPDKQHDPTPSHHAVRNRKAWTTVGETIDLSEENVRSRLR